MIKVVCVVVAITAGRKCKTDETCTGSHIRALDKISHTTNAQIGTPDH